MRRIYPGFLEDAGRRLPAPDSPTNGVQSAEEGLFELQTIQDSSYPMRSDALHPSSVGLDQQ